MVNRLKGFQKTVSGHFQATFPGILGETFGEFVFFSIREVEAISAEGIFH